MSNSPADAMSEGGWSVGGPMDRFTISLRISSEALDPADITDLVGVAPTKAYRKGDRVSPRADAYRKEGAWILRVKYEAPVEVGEGLRDLIALIPGGVEAIARIPKKHGKRLTFGLFLDVPNREFWLSPAEVDLIQAIDVDEILFDIYGPLT